MSHSYWRVIASLGFLILSGGSTAQQEAPATGNNAQSQAIERQADQDGKQAPPAPAPVNPNLKADEAKKAARRQTEREESNLEIQGRMADYTAQSVKMTAQALSFTRWAVGLTTVETLLFILTAYLTIRAVGEAKRSADIAERALEASNRPYIVIKDVQVSDIRQVPVGMEPGQLAFEYEYGNYGSSIGWIVKTFNVLNCPEAGDPPRFIADDDCVVTHWPVTSDQGWGSPHPGVSVNLRVETIADVLAGVKDLYAIGLAVYVSPAGKEYRHRWAYRYDLKEHRLMPWHDDTLWEAT